MDRYNHRWNHRYNHTDEAKGQRGDLSAHPVRTVRVLTLQVARMASGQASHTPVLTAAGAPNVALGLQVPSTPEYPRVLDCVPQEYPAALRIEHLVIGAGGGAARGDDRAKDERGGRDVRADGHAGAHAPMDA